MNVVVLWSIDTDALSTYRTSANNHLRQWRTFLSFTYWFKHGDNNSWRTPRGIRNFWLVGLDDLFPLLLCAQPRGWRAALFIFPVFAAWYFMGLLDTSDVILLLGFLLRVLLFLFRVSFFEPGTLIMKIIHGETIALCCQPFLMFSIVEYRNKGEELSLARRQR